jgi:FAD:protein FMN transferase
MSAALRRVRPALGTLVEFRVEGLTAADAGRAIDAAFAEVQIVHRLMSFHEPHSDLGRLHRAPAGAAVRVNARTHEVLHWALRIAAVSRGCFDPTIAMAQVEAGLLPRPEAARPPDSSASWRDIELLGGERVRLRRPLWIDLGGIAKGYAVDRAIEVLRAHGATQACVNAGGDLRVYGPRAERVHLRTAGTGLAPLLEISDGAVAGSEISMMANTAPHVHGRARTRIVGCQSVSVVAPRCIIADALTKVVLGADEDCPRILAEFGATAGVAASGNWRLLGAAA